MPIFERLVVVAVAVVALATACSDDSSNPWDDTELSIEGLRAIVASSALVPGENRVVVGVLDGLQPLRAASVEATFFNLAGEPAERSSARLDFVPIEGTERGYFVGHVSFETDGPWGVEIRADGYDEVARARFAVRPSASVPGLGDPAPASVTRTLADTPLAELTSDDDPDPSLYEATVAEAVTSGRPAVIAFATPALCTTQTCGPVVDILKRVKASYGSDVVFVHVEVYEAFDTTSPQRVPAVDEWGLTIEPWVFVTDAEGRIAGSFEGIIGEAELRAALDAVLQ